MIEGKIHECVEVYKKQSRKKNKHSCSSEHSNKDRKKVMVHIYKKTRQIRFPFFHPWCLENSGEPEESHENGGCVKFPTLGQRILYV